MICIGQLKTEFNGRIKLSEIKISTTIEICVCALTIKKQECHKMIYLERKEKKFND